MNHSRMPSPAMLVVVLALVAALAGTAVAGPDASTSAISKKKVKKIVRKEVAKQIAGLPDGPPGPQGEDATKLFAYIRDSGDANPAVVEYGSGVTAITDASTNQNYVVTFNRSVVNCVVHGTSGRGDPTGPAARAIAYPSVDMEEGGSRQVEIAFSPNGASVVDTSFFITAFC